MAVDETKESWSTMDNGSIIAQKATESWKYKGQSLWVASEKAKSIRIFNIPSDMKTATSIKEKLKILNLKEEDTL